MSVRNTKPSYNYTEQARDGLHTHASLKTRQMLMSLLDQFPSIKSLQRKCPIKLHVKVNVLHKQEQSSQYTTRFLTYNNLCNNSLQFPRAEFSFSTLSQLEKIWAKTKWEIYHFVGFRKKRGIRWKGLSSLLDFLISPFSFFHSEHIPVLTVHVADNINRK